MPNIEPGRITAILSTAERLGLNQASFNETLIWRRSGRTTRAAIHINEYACPHSGRHTSVRWRIECTFAELADERVCDCVLGRRSPPAKYATLIEHAGHIDELVEALDTTPNWSAWHTATSEHHQYLEVNTRNLYNAMRVTAADVDAVDKIVEQRIGELDRHAETWKPNHAATNTWWEHQLDMLLGDAYTYAIIERPEENTADHGFYGERLCIAQYSIAQNHNGTLHLVHAPRAVVEHLEAFMYNNVANLGNTIDETHAPLVLELYSPECNTDALIDTVLAALPA